MRRFSLFLGLILIGGSLHAFRALASIFPDIPDDHSYRASIEYLVGLEVISGHPDGTFRPADPVNRAEMLKMLYQASHREPRPVFANCFPDVERGSWYELYVCDAAVEGVVQGYSDGRFRPARPVSRVEALKMIMEMLDIEVGDVTENMRDLVKFVDVSTSSWYTKYLYQAFILGILPIAGQDGARFYPDWPLLRGEAAAYIDNAMQARRMKNQSAASTDGEESSSENVGNEMTSAESSLSSVSGQTVTSVTASKAKSAAPRIRSVAPPFEEGGSFEKKYPVLYRFTLEKPQRLLVESDIRAGGKGGIVCRLYHLEEDGFSTEYYLGHEEGSLCTMRVMLSPGSYQLQLSPTVSDAHYGVRVSVVEGDGNDGFVEALSLKQYVPRHGILEGGDYADWYTFYVPKEDRLEVYISSERSLPCIVYPLSDVNLFSFSGPQCNEQYVYPAGTYVVGVLHATPLSLRMTYTLQLKD